MTRAGTFFIIGAAAAYFIASQTQIGWLYLFVAVVLSLLLVSAWLPRFTLKPLSVELKTLLTVTESTDSSLDGPLEDEPVEIRITIRSTGRFARHFVRLKVDFPFEDTQHSLREFLFLRVPVGRPEAVTCRQNAYKRGHYPEVEVTLEASGPLGIFVRRRVSRLPLNLTVFPFYYRLERSAVQGLAGLESGQGVRAVSAADYYGTREYRFGEPLRYVHWRNTARTGDFMLKQFEHSGHGTVAVAFDTGSGGGSGRESTLEYGVKIAASLARLGEDSGRTIDITAGYSNIKEADWPSAMNFLARVRAEEKRGPESELILPPDSVAVIPAVETGFSMAVAEAAARGGVPAVIILHGFGPDEKLSKVSARFEGGNTAVIYCAPGELEATVTKLGEALSLKGGSDGAGL